MAEKMRIGIIICDRYRHCAGGKCFRALREREGAFKSYAKDADVEIAGYTSCGGCPGGNVEYAPEEMIRNGAEVIHFATGLLVGYPPCPRIDHFKDYIEAAFGIPVVMGTHPVPEKYYRLHQKLGTWEDNKWNKRLASLQDPEEVRKAYN